MPTITEVTLNPIGGADYTSLDDVVFAEARNLVTSDEIFVITLSGNWDGYTILGRSIDRFQGWVTDEDHYIQIIADDLNKHDGVWDETKAIIDCSGSIYSLSSDQYIKLCNLQTISNNTNPIINSFGTGTMEIDSCILRGRLIRNENGGDLLIKNTVFTDSELQNLRDCIDARDGYTLLYNTTIVTKSFRNLLVATSGVIEAYNCIVFDNGGTCFANTIIGDYNASSDGTAPGANSILNISNNVFIDFTNNNFDLDPVLGAALIGTGDNLYSDPRLPVTTDITGKERPNSKLSIGAFEPQNAIQKSEQNSLSIGMNPLIIASI